MTTSTILTRAKSAAVRREEPPRKRIKTPPPQGVFAQNLDYVDVASDKGAHLLCTPETLKATVEQFGVAVLPGVLCGNERHYMVELSDHMFEKDSDDEDEDFDKAEDDIKRPFETGCELREAFGVGHMNPMWTVRQHPNVVRANQILYGEKDLVTNFDGAAPMLDDDRSLVFTGRLNLRTEASPRNDAAKPVYRSLFELRGTYWMEQVFCCVPGSHKLHKEFFEAQYPGDTHVEPGSSFELKTSDDLKFFHDRGCKEIGLVVPEGSMIFWDSRMFFDNIRPGAEDEYLEIERRAFYNCMVPRVWLSTEQLEQNIQNFEEQRTTSHAPHETRVFTGPPTAVWPRTDKDIVTPLGRRLIGYSDVPEMEMLTKRGKLNLEGWCCEEYDSADDTDHHSDME